MPSARGESVVKCEQPGGLKGMRIMMVGPLPPPSGGMANQTRQLAELLSHEGSRVEIVQVNAPYRPAWIGHLKGVRAVFRLLPYLLQLWRSAGRVDLAHVMANSGWSWHLFSVPAIWLAHWRGVPVVVNYRGGEAPQFLQAAQSAVRFTMRRSALLAVPSGFLEGIFAGYGMKAEILPNIVNLDLFYPGHSIAVNRNTAPRILVARNLEPLYDVATVLRAFALIWQAWPEAYLTIAGSGPERAALESLALQLGLEQAVRFTGRLSPQQMAFLYRETDISINPSLADNMPNSILESLASGVPVISTNVGGVPYLVRDGITALLVPPSDPEAMATAIIRLVNDEALCCKLICNGLQEVLSYTWANIKARLETLYLQALASRLE